MHQLLGKAKALIAKLRKWVKDNFSPYEEEKVDNQPAPTDTVLTPVPELSVNQMLFEGIKYTFECSFGKFRTEEERDEILFYLKRAVEKRGDLLEAVAIICLHYEIQQVWFQVVPEDEHYEKCTIFVAFDEVGPIPPQKTSE